MSAEDKEFADIETMFNARPPRIKTRVLDYKGKTMFVLESDIIDWERKQRDETICSCVTIGATSVILVMSACILSHIGSPRACLFTIGATLAVCLAAKAYKVIRVKNL